MSAFLFCWPDGDVGRPAQKLVKARCRPPCSFLCSLLNSMKCSLSKIDCRDTYCACKQPILCQTLAGDWHLLQYHPKVKPVVYAQVGGAGLAIIDKAEAGPQFGAEGLSIALQPGRERTARSRLGSYYAKRADGGRSLFGPGEEKGAQLTDLQVTAGSARGCFDILVMHLLPLPGAMANTAMVPVKPLHSVMVVMDASASLYGRC